MNILVTGANGQLGNEMRIVAKESADNYIFTDVIDASQESIAMLRKLAGDDVNTETEHLDITKLESIREVVRSKKIDAIINCAAYTNVDAAEDNYELAELLNAKAPENLAIAMKEVDGLLIHISTDYVFGKEPYNIPCKEDQKGTPTGVYGLTKLHGEQAIQKIGCKYVIIRTAWLYSEFGNNFVKKMLNFISTKPKLKVVFDQVGTPTYAKNLADVLYMIVKDRADFKYGDIYHFSNEGVCSWYDFTKMIAEFAFNSSCDIQPCHSDEFPSKVKRPAFSVLDKTKIKDVYDIVVPYWTVSLKECISHLQC
jgi:dTDP-4-dehydrorhamnose reductase